ncbi:MAG: SDR family NAD(P)-dependent oxidoreductase [Cellvibrionales bacterium]|nr:SDR family NAD(P)-dependent oxidoreductase [Cellvibrionales bacterium]
MKTALITGASEGLGRCFATTLAKQHWRLILVARNEARLYELKSSLPNSNAHNVIKADLSDASAVENLSNTFGEQRIELLINNAGFSRFGQFKDQSLTDELTMLKVNCQALMMLSHAYLQHAQSGDAIINLSSVTAWLPTPVQPTYVATKAFIKAFSENLWQQGRKHGVYVQTLCPGPTRTEFINRAGNISKADLLNKLSGTPESVINLSLNALQKRKAPVVVPGASNKLTAILIRMLPRKWAIVMMGLVSDYGLSE